METRLQPEEDVDALAQDVMNAWAQVTTAGHAETFTKDFSALFERANAYRRAKRMADNRREHNMLTVGDSEAERVTREQFLEAHRSFQKKHQ